MQNFVFSRTIAIGLVAPAALTLAEFPALSATFSGPEDTLPLGSASLTETRTTTQVAPGVTYTQILRGELSASDTYVVSVAFTNTLEAARTVVDSLNSSGFETLQPRIETINERALDDPQSSPLGHLVQIGSFAAEAEATNLLDELTQAGFSGLRVDYTGFDGNETTGTWAVNVLEIDLAEFEGMVAPALATDIVPDQETLTSLATSTNALAAVNGGYFVVGESDGTPGDPAGVSVIDGNLISEAINGRTNLLLTSDSGLEASVATLVTQQAVTSAGITREIDGLNRQPGLIRNCGGVGGDQPTQDPKHDFTCTDPSELILFTSVFGETTVPGEGAEVVLDATGEVVEFRSQRGGFIPAEGAVLSGTGDAAEWLQSNGLPGAQIDLDTQVLANEEPIAIAESLGAINGGPRLLRNGAIEIPATAEGFHQPDNPEFYYRFGVRRNPRTVAGVTADNKLLLIAIDGRQPQWSVGASFLESAQILLSLGAVEGVNLDGGGSTTMTIGNRLVNRPSDATGERPIGDAIIITSSSPSPISVPEPSSLVGLGGFVGWLLSRKIVVKR